MPPKKKYSSSRAAAFLAASSKKSSPPYRKISFSPKTPPELPKEIHQLILGKAGRPGVVLSRAHSTPYYKNIAFSAVEDKPALFYKACENGGVKSLAYVRITMNSLPINVINTGLVIASYNGNLTIIATLLTHPRINVNYNTINNNNTPPKYLNLTPFIAACSQGHMNVVLDFATDSNVNMTALNKRAFVEACSAGHLRIVKFLYTLPQFQDNLGTASRPALFGAAMGGHLNVVKFLAMTPRETRILFNNISIQREILKELEKHGYYVIRASYGHYPPKFPFTFAKH